MKRLAVTQTPVNDHPGVGEGTTPFPGLVNFNFDSNFIILSVKQGASSTIFWVFGMTRPGIEPLSPGPSANMLYILAKEPNKLWKMKVTMILIIVGSLETIKNTVL